MSVMHMIGDDQNTMCGQWSSSRFAWTANLADVTCKRCLRSLKSRGRLDSGNDLSHSGEQGMGSEKAIQPE